VEEERRTPSSSGSRVSVLATKSAGNTRIAVTASACAVVDMKIGNVA
jgi:hypothetical protein